jgi:hypothetical protein
MPNKPDVKDEVGKKSMKKETKKDVSQLAKHMIRVMRPR